MLHKKYNSKKWKMISNEFKEHGYFRNELECRDKWVNCVDPSIVKK
jgi:hypothetical protein